MRGTDNPMAVHFSKLKFVDEWRELGMSYELRDRSFDHEFEALCLIAHSSQLK